MAKDSESKVGINTDAQAKANPSQPAGPTVQKEGTDAKLEMPKSTTAPNTETLSAETADPVNVVDGVHIDQAEGEDARAKDEYERKERERVEAEKREAEEANRRQAEFEAARAGTSDVDPESQRIIDRSFGDAPEYDDMNDDTKAFMQKVSAIVEGAPESTPDSHVIGGTANGQITLGDLRMLYATFPTAG